MILNKKRKEKGNPLHKTYTKAKRLGHLMKLELMVCSFMLKVEIIETN